MATLAAQDSLATSLDNAILTALHTKNGKSMANAISTFGWVGGFHGCNSATPLAASTCVVSPVPGRSERCRE